MGKEASMRRDGKMAKHRASETKKKQTKTNNGAGLNLSLC